MILENRLHQAWASDFGEIGAGLKTTGAESDADALEALPLRMASPAAATEESAETVHGLAAASLTPESGSVAASAGMLATELGTMICNLARSHNRAAEDEVQMMLERLEQLGADLQVALKEDAECRQRVLDAMSLPRATDGEKLARSMAIEQATKNAVTVPLRVAESAMQTLDVLSDLTEICPPNGVSDLALSAQLAMTAIRGATYNIMPNLLAINDKEFAEQCRTQINEMLEEGRTATARVEGLFTRMYPVEN